MTRAHRLWLSVGILAIVSTIALVSQSEPARSHYRFEEPESGPFLTLGYGGGGSPYFLTLKQYASGSAILESTWNGRVQQTTEVPLMRNEVLQEILTIIVSARLHEYDSARLRTTHPALRGLEASQMAAPFDSSVFQVQFVLAEEDSSTGAGRSVRRAILLGDPQVLAERFPSVREYQAMARLLEIYEQERVVAGTPR